MNHLTKTFQHFSYIRIDKFNDIKIDKYPDINYKHYIRFPHFWLKTRLKLNKESKLLLNLLKRRRSVRSFKNEIITYKQLNYILIASLGVSDLRTYYRTYPSAGALYPIECYILLQKPIDMLQIGVYHYNFFLNNLELINSDVDERTAESFFADNASPNASFYILLTCIPSRLVWKYRGRGLGFMYIEAGHIGQNIYLSAQAQNLSCCSLGGFIDKNVIDALKIREDYEYPLYALEVGIKNDK